MRVDIIMPQLGESVVEGTITRWLVKPGDIIQRDQAVVEVATDKADSEVPASHAGRIEAILAGDGEVVKIGQVLCTIETDVSQPAKADAPSPAPQPKAEPAPQPKTEPAPQPKAEPAPQPKAEPAPQPKAEPAPQPKAAPQPEGRETRKAPPRDAYPDTITSPAVRRLALMYGVELSKLTGTGERGRITRDDVLRGAGLDPEEVREPPIPMPDVPPPSKADQPSAQPPAQAQPRPGPALPPPQPQRPEPPQAPQAQDYVPQGAPGSHVPPVPGTGYQAFKLPPYAPREGDQLIPFTRRRRLIADHMVYSKHVSPHVFTVAEIDVDRTVRLREQHKAAYKAESISLTMVAFICSAVVRALREFPGLNARVLDDSYVLLREINLGIAVDTPDGLLVPNIKRADELSMRGIARAISELAGRARQGKLSPDDLSGSTFSVSNPGAKGNLFGAAVISQPNVAILRTGEIKKRVVVIEGEDGADTMAIHPVMYAALSYDHRIIDGVLANSFLWRLSEILRTGDFSL
jgi:2-oxoglutarate dehydrogenase E2 component (dihydrolipoamide succinyltransferase)